MIPKNYFSCEKKDLSLHACQGCPISISNRVENRNWLVLVSLTRWRTFRKIITVANRPVSWCPMSQGAPVPYGSTAIINILLFLCGDRLTSINVRIRPVKPILKLKGLIQDKTNHLSMSFQICNEIYFCQFQWIYKMWGDQRRIPITRWWCSLSSITRWSCSLPSSVLSSSLHGAT